ncbi:major tail protein [Bacillus sp. B-jedd]|uniref:major tail protein n=1 Tax=Bacillus sp. B-jedd TaxID=1476857 RepID=UPI0005156ECE|nr:major tail protein [Bacillus sp. B-jedd]CEG28079.1 phage major tail protein, phi13 family [Bacillus sp. B-jedd]
MNPVKEKVQKVSLKRLHYAVMTDEATETHGEVKTLTMPIELTLTPNFSEASFDAGDQVVANEVQFDTITIAGSVADLPTEVQADWYGHELSAEKGLIVNVNDNPNYLAVGFESGSKLVWLYKAKFKPTEEANATKRKGEITYKQSGFSGEAIPLEDGLLKYSVRTDDEGVTETASSFFASVKKPNTVPAP